MFLDESIWFLGKNCRSMGFDNSTPKAIYQTPPNTACTGRWGFCAIFEQFSGFEFFLLPNRVHARPSASNANRWTLSITPLDKRNQIFRLFHLYHPRLSWAETIWKNRLTVVLSIFQNGTLKICCLQIRSS